MDLPCNPFITFCKKLRIDQQTKNETKATKDVTAFAKEVTSTQTCGKNPWICLSLCKHGKGIMPETEPTHCWYQQDGAQTQ